MALDYLRLPSRGWQASPGFVKALTVASLLLTPLITPQSVLADTRSQAKRIHERLTGVTPTKAVLNQMEQQITDDGNGIRAAETAMENDHFYRVTIKNWVAPWTNRDEDVFVDLNDYIATVMGYVRDGHDFRGILFDDRVYTFNDVTPAFSNSDNEHYQNAEATNPDTFDFKEKLAETTQSSLNGLPVEATAGVMTSRAAAEAFFVDGTNRAMLRFTLLNHMCMDLEQLQDASLPPDRVRQDVSRSPGGDSRVFSNTCATCHSGMDPLAQAFAYYDFDNDGFTNEQGNLVTPATNSMIYIASGFDTDEKTNETTTDSNGNQTRVQNKYHINSTTFISGFITPDDSWDNYWRQGVNGYLGWDTNLPGSGQGAKSMGMELAHSARFARCQVEKVFETVCLREPVSTADRTRVDTMIADFTGNSHNIKRVFARSADYCKGP